MKQLIGGVFYVEDQEVLKIIGRNIRRMRKNQELSQEIFAFIACIDRSYIASVERGERNVSAKNIVKIAKALGMTPGELFQEIK